MGSIGNDFKENFKGEKISIEILLLRIEKNGGATGLDLSGKDLSPYFCSNRSGIYRFYSNRRHFYA